jgi:hypothetical protein
MFWNDPNLYSVAFKDIPNIPLPFYGTFPRYYTPFTPYDVKPNLFTPPIAPTYFTPPVTPQYFTPQIPTQFFNPQMTPQYFSPQINPFLHNPIHRFMEPMVPQIPFNYTLPYFQGYRPFGL